jgi:signal transduction histidine kinase
MSLGIGIRGQLIAGIALTTIAGIGLAGIISIKMIEGNALYLKADEAADIVGFARSGLRGAQGDYGHALKAISLAFKESGISDYEIRDSSGRVALSSGSVSDRGGEVIDSSNGIKIKARGIGVLGGVGKDLFISAPLYWGSGTGGEVSFTLSLQDIGAEVSRAKAFIAIYSVIDSLIIIIFGTIFLSRSIIRPIKDLKGSAERIAGGMLDERVALSEGAKSENEVASLARSFNTMAERLSDEIRALERVNRELLATQDELLRSRTLASVGGLAAGIAHEIGNPLGAVKGYLDILKKGLPTPEEEAQVVSRASKEVLRIDAIVREFLQVARPSKGAPVAVDVNPIVRDALSTASVKGEFNGISTRLSLKDDLPQAVIDEGKLRQVFLNILINAAHSMAGSAKKEITISTWAEETGAATQPARRRRDDSPVTEPISQAGDKGFVCIGFADTGSGISGEDLKRVFDPFFTTKDVGGGSGLGLFVSQGIIKAYGGEIRVASRLNEGSTFTVALPRGGGL